MTNEARDETAQNLFVNVALGGRFKSQPPSSRGGGLRSIVMAQELYRNCTLARCLQSQLDHMVQDDEVAGDLARAVMEQFDKSLAEHMESKQDNCSTSAIQAKLRNYNNCEGVWRFDLGHPTVVTQSETVVADAMNALCCPLPGSETNTRSRT